MTVPFVTPISFLMQENPHGFFPIRDPQSKWYISHQEMPDSVVPWKQRQGALLCTVTLHCLACITLKQLSFCSCNNSQLCCSARTYAYSMEKAHAPACMNFTSCSPSKPCFTKLASPAGGWTVKSIHASPHRLLLSLPDCVAGLLLRV